MDDPWDVKSVRRSSFYTSCMKINGVPLLPPVLSKECRKEMQYYKLLAKEVEKRISILQPYVMENESDSSDDKTDASDIPECEQIFQPPKEEMQGHNVVTGNIDTDQECDETLTSSPLHTELYNVSVKSKVVDIDNASSLIVELTSTIDQTSKKPNNRTFVEIPERDYNCRKSRELLTDTETGKIPQKDIIIKDIINYSFTVNRELLSDPFPETTSFNGPPSLSSKSFTGSLNNIAMESSIEKTAPKLVRQRSYTLLNPSPQLLAHLEVQSLNTGVEMSCISMSDSLNSLTPNKKRRSWDLESAKVKWSNMAQELKQKNMTNPISRQKNPVKQPNRRPVSPQRAKSMISDRSRQHNTSVKSPVQKTEPLYKPRKVSPVRNPTDRTIVREPIKSVTPKNVNQKKGPHEPTPLKTTNQNYPSKNLTQMKEIKSPRSATSKVLISESEDPATKVRELYEKIQKQQLIQMASLVEKQKREQMLLQQVFEEQNSLLFKQLKTICPKSPIEVKEAWGDKNNGINKGPVSLSQLINQTSPERTISEHPLSSILENSNKYISHCDNVLKKSRDISGGVKKQGKCQSVNGNRSSPRHEPESSRTRTNSPNQRATPASRRLNYDTTSSDREYDPILTDRTNDTMADVNVTFPSDSEDSRPLGYPGMSQITKELTVLHTSPTSTTSALSTDSAIKCLEQSIQKSINNTARRSNQVVNIQPTSKQRAAATAIVAHAKGYLVRRLMRTARVQGTVQTIKDALVCALQLHQDREGIRGADVDLHRRLIQQITAACYSLHETFITSTATERCAMIANDRERARRASLAARPVPKHRHSDIMSQSHTGAFPSRPKRFYSSTSLMTQSNYESYSSEKGARARYMPSPRRRPWR